MTDVRCHAVVVDWPNVTCLLLSIGLFTYIGHLLIFWNCTCIITLTYILKGQVVKKCRQTYGVGEL